MKTEAFKSKWKKNRILILKIITNSRFCHVLPNINKKGELNEEGI